MRIVDDEVRLIPYYPNEEEALQWYQDLSVCKQVDNIDHVYDPDRLRAMYGWLSAHGDCYYIEYNGRLVGDVTLARGEISIVVCKEYQNRRIGRRCIQNMLDLAREQGLTTVTAEIYPFNTQSRTAFLSAGFKHVDGDQYAIAL